jgi:6-phosphogluconate dehydrogenase
MEKANIALIGLGTMGQSLARNIAGKGFKIAVYNRTAQTALDFNTAYGNENISHQPSLEDLVNSLEIPRKIILMVKAGNPVDAVISQLIPLLQRGDIIIDAGNSNYLDSVRRSKELDEIGLHFMGMGVSGGEEGALRGPSIMPGGKKEDYEALKPILEAIAARDFDGGPCVTHIGTDGAGHYVKMVHNGIEYGVMQLMAEAYQLLREAYELSPTEIADIFGKFNEGKLKSYLFDISVPILERKDEFNDGYLIDYILDKAGQKGTGRWTVIDALERGVSLPTISMAVFARNISARKDLRREFSQSYSKPKVSPETDLKTITPRLENALYAGMISTYAQGFQLINKAAEEQNWMIDLAEVARIWEGGCIIRAGLLKFLHEAFSQSDFKAVHLFTIEKVKTALKEHLESWRAVAAQSAELGIPMPAMTSSLTYFEEMTSEKTSANFIQGLRDYFGAHTYERTDREGVFHTPWSNLDL